MKAMNKDNPKYNDCIERESQLYERKGDFRTPFMRDYNRIIFTTAYRRLKHKTQVFFAPDNDHICTRAEHVNLVESISYTIAYQLGLNTELTRAISAGHDLGHAPFGHGGEKILSSLSNGTDRKTAFICDEYDKYCTKTDSDFFSLSRESKCINIVSTQSYSSLKSALKDEASVKVITQNLINKIWFRTDDIFTIEEAQKQLGKEEKKKFSKTVSESAKETNFSYITNTLNSCNSNISESYNSYFQSEYIYDTNFFTRELETFTALTFLSDGTRIFEPRKFQMLPYFKN